MSVERYPYDNYIADYYFNLRKTYLKKSKEIPFTLQEFREHIFKNTKYSFLKKQWDGIDQSKRPRVKLDSEHKLTSTIIYFIAPIGLKKCSKCNRILPLKAFGTTARGYDSRCTRCIYIMSFIKHGKALMVKHGGMDGMKTYIEENTDIIQRYKEWDKIDLNLKPILKYLNKDKSSRENIYVTNKVEMRNKSTKKCITCGTIKPISEYHNSKRTVDGYDNKCRSCQKDRHSTKDSLILILYRGQRKSSIDRGHIPPTYTVDEFKDWMYNQDNFDKLYNAWIAKDYDQDLKPSVDRLNDDKGYSFDNIQLVTWRENYIKQNEKIRIPVEVTELNSGIKTKFESYTEAAKAVGTSIQSIVRHIVNGNEYKGYIFEPITKDK